MTKSNPKLAGMPEYGGSYEGAYLLRRGLFMPWEIGDLLTDPGFASEGMRRLAPIRSLQRTLNSVSMPPISRVAALESTRYMRNQLLRDADWAGMAHSLEIRLPLVDTVFLRAVAQATPQCGEGKGKAALASSPSRSLPEEITQRAKTGFGVPIGTWLQHLAENLETPSNKGNASRQWAKFLWDSTRAPSRKYPHQDNRPES